MLNMFRCIWSKEEKPVRGSEFLQAEGLQGRQPHLGVQAGDRAVGGSGRGVGGGPQQFLLWEAYYLPGKNKNGLFFFKGYFQLFLTPERKKGKEDREEEGGRPGGGREEGA